MKSETPTTQLGRSGGQAASPWPEPGAGRQVSPAQLRWITAGIARDGALWRPLVVHDPETRWFTRLWWSRLMEIWLIAWDHDQGVELHDHGGAAGALTVCEGALVELRGHRDQPRQRLRRRTLQGTDGVAFDGGYVHDIVNHSGRPAVSVHAYSPPLASMTFYTVTRSGLAVARTERVSGPEPGVVAARPVHGVA